MLSEFLFAKNPNPMWIYDPETLQFLDVNEAAVRKYKYSKESFLQNTLLLIRDSKEAVKLMDAVKDVSGKSISETGLWLHRDAEGKTFHVKITSLLIDYNGKPARFVQANDVEDFIREQQLNDLLVKRLRKQIIFLRKVAWVQSHQLRARVANILGLLNLYNHKMIHPSEHEECVNLLYTETQQLDGITKKISKKINGYTKLEWGIHEQSYFIRD